MNQHSYWEAYSRTTSQETSPILRNDKVHQIPLLGPILNQMNPIRFLKKNVILHKILSF
jgi:hypothetical protein